MKYLFHTIFALILISCNKPPVQVDNQQAKSSGSIKNEVHDEKSGADTMVTFSKNIYLKYIPSTVHSLLREKLPNWKLPSPDQWEKFWFNHYKTDIFLLNYVFADFNGDKQLDYAFILKNDKEEFAIWVLQSNLETYKPIKLRQFNYRPSNLDVGIELVPAGDLHYIDFAADDVKTVVLKNPAIQLLYFETAAETFYWNNNRYHSVTTGD